ncbi:DUF4367 domain-containing protein [Evansella sp. AB-rgal1]|uniref:DUF4367 domain-containing protein n=1 Tax=Evansella sp. AB-rgal1 TaxID=3242696 RepID=UPI00359D2D25
MKKNKFIMFTLIILLIIFVSLFTRYNVPKDFEEINYGKNEVQQALIDLEFETKYPSYLPSNFSMKSANIFIHNGNHQAIEFYGNLKEREGGIWLIASKLDFNWSEGIVWKSVEINNNVASFSQQLESIILKWQDENIYYRIEASSISKHELIKIAESFQ